MHDLIEILLRSTIQHGPLNNRIYLMHLHPGDVPEIVPVLDELALKKGYTKILVRIPHSALSVFESGGYVVEAHIPGYFPSGGELFFVAKYTSEARRIESNPQTVARNFEMVKSRTMGSRVQMKTPVDSVETCDTRDASEICRTYSLVFSSYPFPITDPDYLVRAMETHTRYFCIRKQGRIAAIAGSEIDRGNRCVEMTDFAVLPEFRGQQMALSLLVRMETEMAAMGMRIGFTISRTLSQGMNLTFRKMGYRFGGKLTNNTHISGGIESMWVWYKSLE